jgi:disulfide bond formation protein DsbB
MTVDAVTTFFALLAVLGIVVVLGSAAAWVVSKVRGSLPPSLQAWREDAAQIALPAAFAVASTATLGSLYLSEVAHFPPCELCWYQRIAMYPLTVVLGVAALRRDHTVKWYVVPIALIGASISAYHYLLERFPDSVASACSTDVPCSTVWVWEFGFLSIPAMAGVGFALITTLVLLGTPRPNRSSSGPDVTTEGTSQPEEVRT